MTLYAGERGDLLHASSREKQPGRTAPAGEPGALRHVLVVDDEESLRHMLVVLLKREGYEATAVASGEQALAELEQRPYDVVLSDIRMPKLGGLELVDEIKQAQAADDRDPDVGVRQRSTSRIEAMKRGAYDYVSKPFRPDEVVLVLKKAEERERLLRENAALKQAAGARAARTTRAGCRR